MEIAVLGIDLGKNSCSVVGSGLRGAGRPAPAHAAGQRGQASRPSLPPCVVAMEACCGAHHLGRLLRGQGHEVRLMSPEYVRPYVKAQKNDDRDAEAIAEAATRPTMRFVELKSEEQLDMQTLHRVRDRLVGERTALINQLRAVLLERGIIVPQGRRKLEQAPRRHCWTDDSDSDLSLSPRIRLLVEDMRARMAPSSTGGSRPSMTSSQHGPEADEAARRLATIPGHRRAERDGAGGGDRQCRDVRARAGSRRLARAGAAAGDDRRQAAAARHQQARQQISAQAADPRRARGAALAARERDTPLGRMAARAAGAGAQEHRRRGAGQQAGADRLGGAAPRRAVRRRRQLAAA